MTASTEIRTKERKYSMRYTKPQVLRTVNADLAIQSGMVEANKHNTLQIDTLQRPSTTAAYEADE